MVVDEVDLARAVADACARMGEVRCRGQQAGVAVIERADGGGTVWTPQRDVDALIADGLLTEVTVGGVTRLVRPRRDA